MGKLTTVLNGLFKKAEDVEKRYESALERKHEEMLAVQAELAEKASGLTELHKMYLLLDVSESTYKKEAEKVEVLQNKVNEIQHELTIMNEYKTDDIGAVLAEIEANQKEVTAETQKEIHALGLEAIAAKHEYLSKLVEVRKRYYETTAPQTKIEALKAKLGMKNRLDYMTGAHVALSMYSVAGAGYINLEVDTKAIHDALQYKRIDSQLVSELKKYGKLEN